MGQGEYWRKLLAGVFFVAGVGVLIIVTFVIGLERGLTEPRFQVTALFREVGGLNIGAPIRIAGVNVGVVGNIAFLDRETLGRNIKVTMEIFRRYERQFKRCSHIAIKTEGVLGEKYIEISIDNQIKEFDLTQPLMGEEPLDLEGMADVFTSAAASFNETSDHLNAMMKQVNYLTKKSQRIMDRVEQKLIDGNLFKLF